jgi:exosortase D (VPLPA-CTERM-specific)
MEPIKPIKQSYWWLPAVLTFGCLLFAYWPTVQGLVRQWLGNHDFSHGLLIAPMAFYIAWQKREQLKKAPLRTDWRALLVLFFSVAVFIVGELGAELFTTRVSLIFFIIGLTWFLYGPEVVKILRFPLGFLFLMLPLPGFIYRNITFPLQILASKWSVKILHMLGVSAYREGNVIDLNFTLLQVVEACNGLRYILPLLTAGFVFAYFGQKMLWKRLVLILATVPIAVFTNIIRIAGTGYIAKYWGNETAQGFFHGFSGWVVFFVGVGIFFILSGILRLFPDKKAKKSTPKKEQTPPPQRRLAWQALAVAVVIIVATPAAVDYLGQVPAVKLKRPLAEFPLSFEGLTGQKAEMDPQIWERVGGQDYLLINYHDEKGLPINFYVAYYEYQRKAGDFVHSPRLCLPGAGWHMDVNHVRSLSTNGQLTGADEGLEFNELVISKAGTRQLTYFWYQGRGRNFTNEFAAKFYMVWDGIFRRRTDGALVRLMMPLTSQMTVKEAQKILDPLALAAARELKEYLP